MRPVAASGLFVNEEGSRRNPTSMVVWVQALPWVVGFGLLSGCAGSTRSPASALAGLSPGTTAIRVTNQVASPRALDRLTIAVDGEVLPLSSIPPEGAAPVTVAKLPLRPGVHSIAVRAKAHAAGSDVLVVGAQQPFHVGRSAASILVAVHAGGETQDPLTTSPVALRLEIQGGRMESGARAAEDQEERCVSLLPVPYAICHAAMALEEATRNRDAVTALCVRDKLVEMRKLATLCESNQSDAAAMAEAEVARLSKQLERCAGDLWISKPDGVTVLPPLRR